MIKDTVKDRCYLQRHVECSCLSSCLSSASDHVRGPTLQKKSGLETKDLVARITLTLDFRMVALALLNGMFGKVVHLE